MLHQFSAIMRWLQVITLLKLARLGFIIVAMAVLSPKKGQAQSDALSALNKEVVRLYQAGKYNEAVPVARRALALAEKKFGLEHPSVAASLTKLGNVYYFGERYAKAEPIFKRALAIRVKALGQDHLSVATSVSDLADVYYYWDGRYAQAAPLYRRAWAIRTDGLGEEHRLTARSIQDLADTLGSQDRHVEAEQLSRRALAIREKVVGPNHADTAYTLNQIAWSLDWQGRVKEAEPFLRRALAIREQVFGSENSTTASSLNHLADNLQKQSRYQEALPLYKRALSIRKRVLGPEHADVARSLMGIGGLYMWQNRVAKAEQLIRRALSIREKALGPDHAEVGQVLRLLANVLDWQGRGIEAEPIYKRALALLEKAHGPNHHSVGEALYYLASFIGYEDQQTIRQLYERALVIFEEALGPNSPWVGACLAGLAYADFSERRYAEAEPRYKRALKIYVKAYGADHPFVAGLLNSFANLYLWQGRYTDAERLYRRSLDINKKSLDPDHYLIGDSLFHIADINFGRKNYLNAENGYKHALDIYKKAFGLDHIYVGDTLTRLANLYFRQKDWMRATTHYRRATDLVIRRTRVGKTKTRRPPGSSVKSETENASSRFKALVKATHRRAPSEANERPQLGASVFLTAQWAQGSEVAAALTKMAVRSTKGDIALARLVRERQDLAVEWQAKDRRLISARTRLPAKRDFLAEQAISARMDVIGTRIQEIDRSLAKRSPDYVAFANPEPLSVYNVRALLGDNEALILYLGTPAQQPVSEESFIWVVTKTDAKWFRSKLGPSALSNRVSALRCGLDNGSWEEVAKARRCIGLLGDKKIAYRLPFNNKALSIAHELYRELLAPAADLIAGKELIIIPSGALTALPFQVLVTQAPDQAITSMSEAHRKAAWLARSHAITMLPSVSSLKVLRRTSKTRKLARQPFFGIGDPVLGKASCPAPQPLSACPRNSGSTPTWLAANTRRGARFVSSILRGGRARGKDLHALGRLCDTAFELRCVGNSLNAGSGTILLDKAATEASIKDLNISGRLYRYRVLHFATHGLLAGELVRSNGKTRKGKLHEAGLVLTPPPEPSEHDDGLLTASEITELKLNADWVILSACNTAAGDRPGTQALSGLARAFFYAGARALLVSHWPVVSSAAVEITTGTLQRMQGDAAISKAEAFRQSINDLIESKPPGLGGAFGDKAHPSYWAPFVLVGEGRR